jgi:hypothetical protein
MRVYCAVFVTVYKRCIRRDSGKIQRDSGNMYRRGDEVLRLVLVAFLVTI